MIKDKFRYDINALRALSVLIVMLFHFFPNFFPGGFVGVDVFFVVSGFFMTNLIIMPLKNDNFSLLDFYKKRFLRIVPPLAVMCLLLLFLLPLILTQSSFRKLLQHAISSLLFLSNYLYQYESGYFDQFQGKVVFGWSLSVEWQFYMLYPIILMCLYSIRRFISYKKTFLTLVSSFCLSLTYRMSTLHDLFFSLDSFGNANRWISFYFH